MMRKQEAKRPRPCNLCGRVLLMTPYQRFCSRCRRWVARAYVPPRGRLLCAGMRNMGQASEKDRLF